MKYVFLVLLLMGLYTSRGQDTVKLFGRVVHPVSDTILVSYNGNFLAYSPIKFYAKIDKKGNFKMKFPVRPNIYTQVELTHGNHLGELMLRGGDSLFVTIDANRFDSSIRYNGRGSEVQNFLVKHTLARGRMNQYTIKLKNHLHLPDSEYLQNTKREYTDEIEFLEANKTGLSATFINWWKAFHQYYNYFFIQQYPQTYEMLKLRRYTDTIPVENYSVVKQMPLAFYDSLLDVPPYLLYLTGVFDTKLKAGGLKIYRYDTAGYRKMLDTIDLIANRQMPNGTLEFFLAQNLYGRARGQNFERTSQQFNYFKSKWPGSVYLPLLQSQVSMAESLSPGHPAPDIDLVMDDGTHKKLSDLRGKVVYLGFWAGWCRQCIGEVIAENKVKDLLRNKPLEFVYISLGDDTSGERQIMARYKVKGIFARAKGGWESKEVKLFGVQSLPAYYLVDEDGNFATQLPPSPMQSTELVVEISKLFN